jgi:hypothetical protein
MFTNCRNMWRKRDLGKEGSVFSFQCGVSLARRASEGEAARAYRSLATWSDGFRRFSLAGASGSWDARVPAKAGTSAVNQEWRRESDLGRRERTKESYK